MSHILSIINLIEDNSKYDAYMRVASQRANDIMDYGKPALRHKETGKIIIGRRGEIHSDIHDQHNAKPDVWEDGFHNPKTKEFYPKDDHVDGVVGVDSTDLMTPSQLKRHELKYGFGG